MKFTLLLSFLFLFSTMLAQKQDSLAIKNGMLHYYTYGQGEPILILSGGPGVSAKQEDDLALELSKKYKCVLLDQRGTGKSWVKPMNASTINLETAVQDIEALRLHLGYDKISISGHSWGAMLASAYAQRHPGNINKLILIGAGELTAELSPAVTKAIKARRSPEDAIAMAHWTNKKTIKEDPARAEYETRKIVWKSFIHDPGKLEQVLAQVVHGDFNSEMSKLMWKDLEQQKFDFSKQTFQGPTLVIYGLQDPVGSMTADQYANSFPNATLHPIDQCGHMPTVEQPAEFYRTLWAFLSK